MIRPLRVALTGSAFALFALGGALLGWVVLPLLSLVSSGPERERQRLRLAGGAYRLFVGYMRACGLIRFEPPALPPDLPRGPCVVVANHPSLIDVLMILVTMPWVRCMVKPDWLDNPLVARLIEAGGHFPGPRRRRDVSLTDEPEVLGVVLAQLAQGAAVLIFPEGTRSPEGGLQRFRKGAAEAAIRARVPLVPLRLRCEPSTLRKGQRWYEVPDRTVSLCLEFLPPFAPGEHADAASLTRAARERIGGGA